ncbi:hypothetical protein VTH8203_01059 [Vibrio thalassae]|uniref:DUF5062 domain-containing protein n=1 Tax=Vibrio thalassae TaxID=1243014 RepID=A0A240EHK7_9VIBR|nr:DUF5062 family protein [Vibrio thalassae]SNX47455.1 hypothetical protein VTH8203_01059 [Vibrio thalassae]
MKGKMKDEDKLFKQAISYGLKLADMQGYQITDKRASQKSVSRAVYLFLVKVQLLTPLPVDKTDGPSIKRRLAVWMKRVLKES